MSGPELQNERDGQIPNEKQQCDNLKKKLYLKSSLIIDNGTCISVLFQKPIPLSLMVTLYLAMFQIH